MNYKEASKQLTGRCKDSRKLCNNTYLQRREGDAIAVRLHNTDVLTFTPDGSTVYDSGGWKTVTTKQRMNEYGPLCIWSERGAWVVGRAGWNRVGPYADGLRVGPRGGVYGLAQEKDLKKSKALRGKIADYARLCSESVPLDVPGAGDCMFCYMFESDDTTHLHEHMREGYVVPSLVYQALTDAGYSPRIQIIHGLVFGDTTPGNMLGLAQEAVRKSVTKYMRHQLRGEV